MGPKSVTVVREIIKRRQWAGLLTQADESEATWMLDQGETVKSVEATMDLRVRQGKRITQSF